MINVKTRNLGYLVRRLIYILCFSGLCLIDQVVGSATGYIQYGLKYYTVFLIAIIILTAYDFNDFFKIPYCIWLIVFFACRDSLLEWGMNNSSNYLEWQTKIWCLGIYGIVIVRFFYLLFVDRIKIQIKSIPFVFVSVMLCAMFFIRTDWTWPKMLFLSLICFYFTEFPEERLTNLYIGIADGIILGFFIIQIQAWMYRPYDTLRYSGMYSHANMNALMYVCTYCAILGKWYLLRLQRKIVILRVPLILLEGVVLSTMLFTGSRTAFVTAIAVSIVFLFFQFLSYGKRKLAQLIITIIALAVSLFVGFTPAYGMLRYIPSYVGEPLYFEGDKVDEKVNVNDSIASEKYYEIDEALDGNITRYLWFLEDEEADRIEEELLQWFKKLFKPLQVQASKVIDGYYWYATDEVYIEPGTDSKHPLLKPGVEYSPLETRYEIYKYFWNKLSLVGDKNNPQGVWLVKTYQATHCHNIFLQMAYDFGIIVGIMFIIISIMLFNRIIFGLTENKSSMWYYRLFITAGFATIEVVFGMTEMAYIYGQLPLTMFWLVQYIVYHKQPHEIEAEQASKNEEDLLLATPSGVVIEDGLEIIDMDKE